METNGFMMLDTGRWLRKAYAALAACVLSGATSHAEMEISSATVAAMSDAEVVELLALEKSRNLASKEVIERLRAMDRPQESHLADVLLVTWMRRGTEGNERQRGWCLEALRWIKSEKLVEVLAEDLLHGKTRGERMAAARHLESIDTEKAIAALESAVVDDEGVLGEGRSIARAAIEALGGSGSQGATALTRIWNDVKLKRHLETSIIGAMGRTKDRGCLRILVEVLERGGAGWRAEAARALGESRDASVLSALKTFSEDGDPNVRRQVSDAIRKIEGAEK